MNLSTLTEKRLYDKIEALPQDKRLRLAEFCFRRMISSGVSSPELHEIVRCLEKGDLRGARDWNNELSFVAVMWCEASSKSYHQPYYSKNAEGACELSAAVSLGLCENSKPLKAFLLTGQFPEEGELSLREAFLDSLLNLPTSKEP